MLKNFIKYIEKNKLTDKNEKILLAVSGGPDSVVMADLFFKAGYKFAIAHCNFKLRGKDSDTDEHFVKKLAQKYNVNFFLKICNAAEYAKKNKISIEMAARDLRYNWFDECSKKNNFQKIAIAHHLNDNVETILLNLARKTGINGLTGIKPMNGKIIRPLLWTTKNQIENYCIQNKLSYRIDKTNQQTDFQRNKIRHIIIPEFEKINPAFNNNIIATAKHLEEYKKIIDQYISEIKNNCLKKINNNYIEINKNCLKKTASIQTVLYEITKKYGFNETQCSNIENSINKSGLEFYSKNYKITLNRKNLIIEKINNQNNDIQITIDKKDIGKTIHITDTEIIKIEKLSAKSYKIDKNPNTGNFDFDKIKFPLTIRNWQAGDWFIPLGMKGKKKLSDFFNDKKIDINKKNKIKIIESNSKIVWIAGYRPDERFKINKQTITILKLTLLSK